MPLFCMARDLVCVFFSAALALLLSHCPMTVVQSGCIDFTEINQKCGQRPNGGDKADDTVGNRVGGSGGDQLAATRPTCC